MSEASSPETQAESSAPGTNLAPVTVSPQANATQGSQAERYLIASAENVIPEREQKADAASSLLPEELSEFEAVPADQKMDFSKFEPTARVTTIDETGAPVDMASAAQAPRPDPASINAPSYGAQRYNRTQLRWLHHATPRLAANDANAASINPARPAVPQNGTAHTTVIDRFLLDHGDDYEHKPIDNAFHFFRKDDGFASDNPSRKPVFISHPDRIEVLSKEYKDIKVAAKLAVMQHKGSDLTLSNATPEFERAFARALSELRAEGQLLNSKNQAFPPFKVWVKDANGKRSLDKPQDSTGGAPQAIPRRAAAAAPKL